MTGGVHKKMHSKRRRALRGLFSAFDPRAYLHAMKLLNYFNYIHVQQVRLMTVGRGVAISPNCSFNNAERIALADGVRLGARCSLWAGPGTGSIVVGENALFGPEVFITAAGYRFNEGTPVTSQAMEEGDVVIGRDVWIAARVMIMPGVTIGDGAVIGAGAVVTKNIPTGSIAVGSPAKVVGRRAPVYPGADAAAPRDTSTATAP